MLPIFCPLLVLCCNLSPKIAWMFVVHYSRAEPIASQACNSKSDAEIAFSVAIALTEQTKTCFHESTMWNMTRWEMTLLQLANDHQAAQTQHRYAAGRNTWSNLDFFFLLYTSWFKWASVWKIPTSVRELQLGPWGLIDKRWMFYWSVFNTPRGKQSITAIMGGNSQNKDNVHCIDSSTHNSKHIAGQLYTKWLYICVTFLSHIYIRFLL